MGDIKYLKHKMYFFVKTLLNSKKQAREYKSRRNLYSVTRKILKFVKNIKSLYLMSLSRKSFYSPF